jgi:hypothetical protein
MPRTCTVCQHRQVAAINQRLVAGEPLRTISALYRGISEDALFRHRAEHIPAALRQAAEQAGVRHAIDLVQQLKAINAASLEVLQQARKQGKGGLVLFAVDRIQRQIELQAKLLGELDERPTINVLVTPEWHQVRALLLTTLQPYPDARTAVAGALVTLESKNGHRA